MSSMKALYLHKPLFVLPFRFGTIIVLGIVVHLAAILSALLWYEYAVLPSRSEKRTAFLAQALVQDVFVAIAVIGAVGLFWNKRYLVKTHAACVFAHLIANISCAAYFIWNVEKGCIPDVHCASYKIPKTVYLVFVWVIVVIELYHFLVIVNFLHQLQVDEKDGKDAVLAWDKSRAHHERLTSVESVNMGAYSHQPFDPESSMLLAQQLDSEAAEGYGGGRLCYDDISREEKERMHDGGDQNTSQMYTDNVRPVSRQEVVDLQLPSYHVAR